MLKSGHSVISALDGTIRFWDHESVECLNTILLDYPDRIDGFILTKNKDIIAFSGIIV